MKPLTFSRINDNGKESRMYLTTPCKGGFAMDRSPCMLSGWQGNPAIWHCELGMRDILPCRGLFNMFPCIIELSWLKPSFVGNESNVLSDSLPKSKDDEIPVKS